MRLRQAQGQVAAKLETLYASSRAPDVWMLVSALGPLTRAELSRALGITKRTASMGVTSLARAGLVRLRAADNAVIVAAI